MEKKQQQEQEPDQSPSPSQTRLGERTESESSVDSMTRFVVPSLDGSPPKIVTIEEVSGIFKDLRNMELAHEIALNPDFKLKQYEPPTHSFEGRVKAMVHKAYWDVLRTQLERQPPQYDQAIRLLAEIKECIPQLVAPNERTISRINEVLDTDVIRQQAEQGVLDFKAYADFVILILSQSCSAARDEAVAELRKMDDVVDTFRSILELMALMKLDMANFMLELARKEISANSVQYEKEKLSKYLHEFHGKAGFPATEDWLQRNRSDVSNHQTIYNGYMELIDYPADKEFPELLRIDKERFAGISWRAQRLILCASLISIAQSPPIISQRPNNRAKLAKQLEIIMQDVKDETQVPAALESCYEQIRCLVNSALSQEQQPDMDEANLASLKSQLMQLSSKTSPVRSLMAKRLDLFVRVSLRADNHIPPPPAGFKEFEDELTALISSLLRLITYNHAVFGEQFFKILEKAGASAAESPSEPAAAAPMGGRAQVANP
ncbi:T-complex protein 11-like protein 2 [Drosophila madeirensis]|uniref:T-complex protein 11-like protein 2 n=1 Tax=Drosophila madeirensis TaxID=30013 RepID=A0AAU9G5I3_DROMD